MGLPLTAQDLAAPLEPEPGRELQFCPIRGVPINRGQRVRTLPGFHLLSLDAGKEALARGSYTVFDQQFLCQGLEHLHPDDRVFICTEDHRAFLNQMSMQYHRYIRHELEARKAERQRLRARAEERKDRRLAHQAHQLQQLQLQQAQPPRQRQVPDEAPLQEPRAAELPKVPAQRAALAKPRGTGTAATAAPAADIPGAAMEEPLPGSVAPAQLPGAAVPAVTAAASAPAASPAPAPSAEVSAGAPAHVAALGPAAVVTPDVAATAPPPIVPARRPAPVEPPAASALDEDDLYGGLGEPEAKRAKATSSYAKAIDSMLADDFDEED